MALVPGAHVVGGDGPGAVAVIPARPRAVLGRPPCLLAPPPAPPPHPLRGGDSRRQVPHRGGGLVPPPPPRYPGPEARWRDVAWAVHALLPLVTDVWWTALLEPGEIRATAWWPDVLRRTEPGPDPDRLHEVHRGALRVATGSRAAPRVGSPRPYRWPVAGHCFTLSRTLHRPARPPWEGNPVRLPDHGAAGLGLKINLQACLAAPLSPLLAPPDNWRPSIWVGWV